MAAAKSLSKRYPMVPEGEGILEEVSAKAHKRLLSLQLADIMQEKNMTKTSLAEKLKTSRSQLDRILDPNNTSITIEVLEHVAHVGGSQDQPNSGDFRIS